MVRLMPFSKTLRNERNDNETKEEKRLDKINHVIFLLLERRERERETERKI